MSHCGSRSSPIHTGSWQRHDRSSWPPLIRQIRLRLAGRLEHSRESTLASKVVLSFFKDEAAADAAAADLKAWDKIDDSVKLTAIGVLALDEKGKVKIDKLGSRSTLKGAGVGVLLAAITPLGLGVVIAGAAFGSLRHKGLGLKGEDRERIGANLTNGQAAVGVLAKDAQADLVAAKLAELGGVTETHDVSDEAVAEADAAAPAIEAEAEGAAQA
jgi:uncharacterized membrane protein